MYWIDKKRCTGCRKCAEVCTNQAISFVDTIAVIDYQRCAGCGDCMAVCKRGAIKWAEEGTQIFNENVDVPDGIINSRAITDSRPRGGLFRCFSGSGRKSRKQGRGGGHGRRRGRGKW